MTPTTDARVEAAARMLDPGAFTRFAETLTSRALERRRQRAKALALDALAAADAVNDRVAVEREQCARIAEQEIREGVSEDEEGPLRWQDGPEIAAAIRADNREEVMQADDRTKSASINPDTRPQVTCEAPGGVEDVEALCERLFNLAGMAPNPADWTYSTAANAIRRLSDELAEAHRERDEFETQIKALEAKLAALAPHGSCACSYDKPDDVCWHHSPALQAAERRAEVAEALAQQRGEALDIALTTLDGAAAWMRCEVRAIPDCANGAIRARAAMDGAGS